MKKFIKAVITLFKSVPMVQNISNVEFSNDENVTKGFFITETVAKSCPIDEEILKFIEGKFGYDIFELNQGFYKSFQTVTELSQQEILANKLLHYLSTYGFEQLGIFNHDTVFIPNAELNLPDDAKPVKLTIINAISNEKIKSRAENLIMSGAALSNDTIENLTTIIKYLKMKLDVDSVPNKELRVRLYDMLNILPKNPVEFLRYAIFLMTGSTLLIKSRDLIRRMKSSSLNKIQILILQRTFRRYIDKNGLANLASIFHRYKPLWLAFKKRSPFITKTVNKMRKLADEYHKPLKPKILDTVTSNPKINMDELKRELQKITVFKRISLVNAILFRKSKPENIAYRIRNGKIFSEEYAKSFEINPQIFSALMKSIVEIVRPNVEGKKIYLPESLDYAAPISEKKFIGEIPFGTSYNFENKSVIVGVHWFNLPDERVDLDLHLNSTKRSIGWNNDFTEENFADTKTATVIFSGDMTDAPKDKGGATEAYFIGESVKDEMMMINLNRYTYHTTPIPFKMILGDVKDGKIDRNYLIDSHEISFCMPSKIDGGEMFIGFLYSDVEGNKKFYFTLASTNERIIAQRDENALRMISALQNSLESCLKLKDILKDAGAIFEKADNEDWDINLDPQVVTKDTILNLFKKVSD